jgi:hypothetical protein
VGPGRLILAGDDTLRAEFLTKQAEVSVPILRVRQSKVAVFTPNLDIVRTQFVVRHGICPEVHNLRSQIICHLVSPVHYLLEFIYKPLSCKTE